MSDDIQTKAGAMAGQPAGKPGPGDDAALNRSNQAGQTFAREAAIDAAQGDKDRRVVRLAFASETPVRRIDWESGKEYDEVLSCRVGEVNLSRLNNAHPLLLNHDTSSQVGVVLRAWVDADATCRADVQFSRSRLGDEIWQDTQDGIRRLVSVGYRRLKELSREDRDGVELIRYAWEPYEISIVPIPADTSVGIGRSQDLSEVNKAKKMSDKIEVTQTPPANIAEINTIAGALAGKVKNVDAIAARAIAENWSVEKFRAELVAALPQVEPVGKPQGIGLSEKEARRYSLAKAVADAAEGRLSGFEREVSDEYSARFGQKPKGQFWVPYEALAVRDVQQVATNSLGGYLKGTELLASEFIEMLRNRAIVMRMGARPLFGLVGDVTIPKQVSASTAAWAASELASVSASYAQFGSLSLAPKECIAKVSVSKKLITQATPSVEQLMRDDIAAQIALAIDLAALHGSGSSGEPSGIYTSSTNLITLATNGAALATSNARAAMISLESAIGVANIDVSRCAFVTNPKVKAQLRSAENATGTASFVWSDVPGAEPGDGAILGYRAAVTNQVLSDRTVGTAAGTCASVFFGDWSQLIVATWGAGLDILVDPYVNASTRLVNIYATQYADIGMRYLNGIAVLKGVIVS